MGKKERRLRVPKVPELELLSCQVKQGTPALVRADRAAPWQDYVTARTQWYSADECCTAGVGQLLIRRGNWEMLVDEGLVAKLLGNKKQSVVRESRGLSLEETVLAALRKKPRNCLSWTEVDLIFGYALHPDRPETG